MTWVFELLQSDSWVTVYLLMLFTLDSMLSKSPQAKHLNGYTAQQIIFYQPVAAYSQFLGNIDNYFPMYIKWLNLIKLMQLTANLADLVLSLSYNNNQAISLLIIGSSV